ncbi:hypothetical protein vseg_015755 [Gypsophila vaccaria]
MGTYDQDDNLDEYEDDFIDDQDGGIGANRYDDEEVEDDGEEEEEEEEEEVEEEPISEEAMELLKYRQQLKEELRSKLRKENGDVLSKSLDRGTKPPLNNFGSFFGPSQPVIADRVAQESKALLESRHLAPKSAASQNNGKKANLPAISGAKNEGGRQPNATQVKSKAELLKQTRDYSFLLADDADVPKPQTEPVQSKNLTSKPESRPAQVPAQSNRPSGQLSRKVANGHEQRNRKPLGTPQVCSTRTAPVRKVISDNRTTTTVVSSDSRRQQDLRKQPQPTKSVRAVPGNGSIKPPIAKTLPPKKPISSTDRKVLMERKAPVASVGCKDRVPLDSKKMVSNGQRPPVEKSRAPGVIRSQERNVNAQQGRERVLKKENANVQVKPPKHSALQANIDRDRVRAQKPHAQLSVRSQSGSVRKDSNTRKRRAEEIYTDEDDDDYRTILWKLMGRPKNHYVDDDDDDDKCMEVGFDVIQREESRSARIARQEDEEELAKIMEEEKRERLRKKAKMHKTSQR